MRSCKSTTKICLSCRHWQGKFSVKRTAKGKLYYTTNESYSKCNNCESGFYQENRAVGNCCKNHDFR